MTPVFRPAPNPHGAPPVLIAAVGPQMTSVAAEVGDGMLVHAFTTRRYLREVTLPRVQSVLEKRGRGRDRFTLSYPGLLATGRTEEELASAVAAVRKRIAFYGATPAYSGVLELHGWGELHAELKRLAKEGRWDAMGELVDDAVLHEFAVVGPPGECAREIRRRFDGLVDRFTPYTPYTLDEATRKAVVAGLHED